MIELRYNGCPDCLSSSKILLASMGLMSGRDYNVEFHKEHKNDAIYKKRPDYIKHFSGAILYNPQTKHWVDLYVDGNIISASQENKRTIAELVSGK